MPIDVPMKQGFLYLGATQADAEDPSVAFCIPYANDMPFATNYRAQVQKSASGKTVGQQIGRPYVTQDATWERYDSREWWKLNQWLETNGMCFYCHYFDFNYGVWKTREFMVSQISCTPFRPAGLNNLSSRGEPIYYTNCRLTLTDMGG